MEDFELTTELSNLSDKSKLLEEGEIVVVQDSDSEVHAIQIEDSLSRYHGSYIDSVFVSYKTLLSTDVPTNEEPVYEGYWGEEWYGGYYYHAPEELITVNSGLEGYVECTFGFEELEAEPESSEPANDGGVNVTVEGDVNIYNTYYIDGDFYGDSSTVTHDTVIGNELSNIVWAYDGEDSIDGEGGDDSLYGNKGDDTLTGGDGSDWIYAGQDEDLLYGNQDEDTLYGHKGDDIVYAGKDDDAVYGNQGSDDLFGNHGDDMVFAGQGDDYLDGGSGDDLLWGHKGADLFHLSAGYDVIYDFSSADGDRLEVSKTSTLEYQQIGSDLMVWHDDGTALLSNTTLNVSFFESTSVVLI